MRMNRRARGAVRPECRFMRCAWARAGSHNVDLMNNNIKFFYSRVITVYEG